MESRKNVDYRFELARGFLNEAEEDFTRKHWRSCVAGSILVIENTALAVLMLFGVSSFIHKPGKHLLQLLSEKTVTEEIAEMIREMLPALEKYDSNEKMLVKFGDESSYQLPWDLFHEGEGLTALESARKCMRVSVEIAALIP